MLFENRGKSASPVDDAREWLDRVGVWPLRVLCAAFICPIIIAFAGQTQFVWPWDTIGEEGSGAGFFVLVPVLSIALLFGSRFFPQVKTRALLCAAAGFLSVIVLSVQASWTIGALFLGLVAVAAGNRVSKSFAMQKAPSVVAAVGGATIWIFALWPIAESSAVGALFTGSAWSGGGWMFCFALVGLLVYAACGIGLMVPQLDRQKLQKTISMVARGVLVWMPACLLFGRISLGPEMGMFDGGGITTFTLGFKMFGMIYAILIAAAVGVAAWMSAWMWDNLDTPVSVPESAPEPPSMAPEEDLEAVEN